MRAFRLLVAFVAGACLYQVVVVFIGGILAAVGVPGAYFAWFGRPRLELALAVLQFAIFAFPVTVLVAGGTLSVQRVLRGDSRAVLWAVLAGLVVSYAFTLGASVFALASAEAPESSARLVAHLLLPSWWVASGALAPWFGFVLAAWLTLRVKAQ